MNELELVRELSRRTSLPEESAAAVLHAMHDLIDDGTVDRTILLGMSRPPDIPPDDPGLVENLIVRAKKHPFGIEFLASGLLATVAITLGAHAFTVEAARRRLAAEEESPEDDRQDQEKEDEPK